MTNLKPRSYPKAYPLPPKAYPKPPVSYKPPTASPKPSHHYQELSDAELAAYARRIARINAEINKLQGQIAEYRREQNQIANEINIGTNQGIIEECSQCHERHEGVCNE